MAPLIELFDTGFMYNVLTTMTRDAKLLRHVGAVDSWPINLTRSTSAAMIFNTDYPLEAGEHWVAVFIDGLKRTAYLFDSLPVRPFPQNVLHKLGKMRVSVRNTNPERFNFQHPDFPLCGLYCLAFLDHISRNKPFHLCVDNQLSNDISVVKYVLPFIDDSINK
jgi:hypothetical protein